jgi:hypothetical protein
MRKGLQVEIVGTKVVGALALGACNLRPAQARLGAYANTAATGLFLDRNKQAYVGSVLEIANARTYPFWGNLTEALKSGLPQNEVKHGDNFFASLYADADRLANFLRAMTGLSMGATTAIAGKFRWADHKTFADIGTAQGGLPVQWPSPTLTSRDRVSTCLPFSRISRPMSANTVSPTASVSAPAISSPIRSRRRMCWS